MGTTRTGRAVAFATLSLFGSCAVEAQATRAADAPSRSYSLPVTGLAFTSRTETAVIADSVSVPNSGDGSWHRSDHLVWAEPRARLWLYSDSTGNDCDELLNNIAARMTQEALPQPAGWAPYTLVDANGRRWSCLDVNGRSLMAVLRTAREKWATLDPIFATIRSAAEAQWGRATEGRMQSVTVEAIQGIVVRIPKRLGTWVANDERTGSPGIAGASFYGTTALRNLRDPQQRIFVTNATYSGTCDDFIKGVVVTRDDGTYDRRLPGVRAARMSSGATIGCLQLQGSRQGAFFTISDRGQADRAVGAVFELVASTLAGITRAPVTGRLLSPAQWAQRPGGTSAAVAVPTTAAADDARRELSARVADTLRTIPIQEDLGVDIYLSLARARAARPATVARPGLPALVSPWSALSGRRFIGDDLSELRFGETMLADRPCVAALADPAITALPTGTAWKPRTLSVGKIGTVLAVDSAATGKLRAPTVGMACVDLADAALFVRMEGTLGEEVREALGGEMQDALATVARRVLRALQDVRPSAAARLRQSGRLDEAADLTEGPCKRRSGADCEEAGRVAQARGNARKAAEFLEAGCSQGRGTACLAGARMAWGITPSGRDSVRTFGLLERGCQVEPADACVAGALMVGASPAGLALLKTACRRKIENGCVALGLAAPEYAAKSGAARTYDELRTRLLIERHASWMTDTGREAFARPPDQFSNGEGERSNVAVRRRDLPSATMTPIGTFGRRRRDTVRPADAGEFVTLWASAPKAISAGRRSATVVASYGYRVPLVMLEDVEQPDLQLRSENYPNMVADCTRGELGISWYNAGDGDLVMRSNRTSRPWTTASGDEVMLRPLAGSVGDSLVRFICTGTPARTRSAEDDRVRDFLEVNVAPLLLRRAGLTGDALGKMKDSKGRFEELSQRVLGALPATYRPVGRWGWPGDARTDEFGVAVHADSASPPPAGVAGLVTVRVETFPGFSLYLDPSTRRERYRAATIKVLVGCEPRRLAVRSLQADSRYEKLMSPLFEAPAGDDVPLTLVPGSPAEALVSTVCAR